MSLINVAPISAALLVVAALWWRMKAASMPVNEPEPAVRREFRCGTLHLQSGGTLIVRTGDLVEIVTQDRTETMTADEARKLGFPVDDGT